MTALLGSSAALAVASTGAQAEVDDGMYQAVPRPAACAPGGRPETGYQGQVSLAERAGGFDGFSCNLTKIGQSQGEGTSWQVDWYDECAYYDTANRDDQVNKGAVVLDVSDPRKPKPTAYLDTPGVIHAWEGLKVHRGRGLLAAQSEGQAPFDVYDLKGDCRKPQLLSTTTMPDVGHEGEWSPDGRTYWGSSTSEYHAIDVSDPRKPKQLLTWKPPSGAGTHGMSFSPDGMRAYFVTLDIVGYRPLGPGGNGVVIADISDIQLRKPNPQIRVISEISWPEGTAAQHTIPVTIGGKEYLVHVDELGAAGLTHQTGFGCASGLSPWGVPRIIDITDEKRPKVVSKLTLETNAPQNCAVAHSEVGQQGIFAYDSHYCEVDRRIEATALACGYFNSGVRVFDIRDPLRPKEIAYFNPPGHLAQQNALRGSEHVGGKDGDWCSQRASFHKGDNGRWQLWTTCQDSGFMVLEFAKGTYPLPPLRKG